ncbi:hypothetical protein [Pararcticibacter amylolyticus]|uniref:Uncharacterized protein n=1 Tax=Pararcticibacter amylolyticus TaxID=2173175 RepID=A0A2U2PF04_9SPHI|nr:hypothetical protein [Pararcticibacter amylolyticus]PWG79985.1 hypothetical protein DDR33_14415 [Pararcticibacter amylolyticus]
MKNITVFIKKLSLYILIPGLLFSGCGNKKKIRLRLPDSSALRLSGRWVLTDTSAAKMNGSNSGIRRPDKITRLDLNANHSANIYRNDSLDVHKTNWQIMSARGKEEGSATSSSLPVILITGEGSRDTLSLSIIADQQAGDTILTIPNHFSYRKDK